MGGIEHFTTLNFISYDAPNLLQHNGP